MPKKIIKKLRYFFLLFFILGSSISFKFSTSSSTNAVGVFLNESKNKGAQCLDGSAPLYYHLAGTDSGSNKWYLHFEGGGWCQSFSDCFDRSKTNLGSTLQDPSTKDLSSGYFSNNLSKNPLMFNWNKVFIRYCDGGSFSGDSQYNESTNILYFRGKKILKAVLMDLKSRGFEDSTDVVISGASAGGLASYLHADKIKKNVGVHTKVVALPDSGFFLDFKGENVDYHSGMKWVFENMNCSRGVNKKCVENYKEESWKCFFAEYSVPFIETPIFALHPKYDSWQVDNVLGSRNETKINDFGKESIKRIRKSLLYFEKNSGFIDSCFHHCGLWNAIHIGNVTQAEAFNLWYNGKEKNVFTQDEDYLCEHCCI